MKRRAPYVPHPKNRSGYRKLDRVAADPRVKEIWSEEGSRDGIWIQLMPGFDFEGVHCIHRNFDDGETMEDLLNDFEQVEENS